MLSRIDGKASEAELVRLTGLNESQIRATLERLIALRVVSLEAKDAPSGPNLPADAEAGAPAPSEGPALLAARVEAAMAAVPRDAPELTEDVDLAAPLRLRVLGTVAVLESLDYYELLTVDRAADKKVIKRSYFELASIFHPDRYFRKRLGSFKPKMESIFGRVTQAHDTLTSKELRAEYDAYLADLDRTRAVEDLLRGADEEARRAEQDAQRAANRSSVTTEADPAPPREARRAPTANPPPNGAGGVAPAPQAKISGLYSSNPVAAPPPLASSRPPTSSPAVSEQARRDVLAMRLLGNRAPPRVVSTPPPTGAPPSRSAAEAGEALKRRYEERVAHARKAQADKYIAIAREAETKNDVLGAATAYKVVLGFLKESDPLRAHALAAIAKSEAALSETYLRQAQYEERSAHWTDAARSWQRVARGRPNDARAHERAANALVLAKGDLHAAAELAKAAIAMDPRNAEFKVTLAQVFIEAGLGLNARRELEAAAQLSPRNANIQALLKRVNKAG